MTTKITWAKPTNKVLYFKDIPVNSHFVIATSGSRGAVYRKVEDHSEHCAGNKYLQMEEYTGKLFEPTYSPVQLVEVDIDIKAKKPSIYG